jgi:hypothetical protein
MNGHIPACMMILLLAVLDGPLLRPRFLTVSSSPGPSFPAEIKSLATCEDAYRLACANDAAMRL